MRYHVLATDYDGTLAHDGIVDDKTIQQLQKLKDTGRKLVLVTGRRLEPILEIFPQIGLFDYAVVENGAVLYNPANRAETVLTEPPAPEFLATLLERGVTRVEAGRVIVAGWEPDDQIMFDTIRDLNLELQIIFNKDAVMVLPSGINKATGLLEALKLLHHSPLNTIAVGDAENDESFFRLCGLSVAVDNALQVVKERADLVMSQPRGAGVCQLIDRILENDLADIASPRDEGLLLGDTDDGEAVYVSPWKHQILVVGDPASGKSRFVLGLIERAVEQQQQVCIFDPEGDYGQFDHMVDLGTGEKPPAVEEILSVLDDPTIGCVANLSAIEKKERPKFFNKVLLALVEYHNRTGRPHWIVVDEAHYMLPADRELPAELDYNEFTGLILVTAFPERLHTTAQDATTMLVAIGEEPERHLEEYCQTVEESVPRLLAPADDREHHAIVWWRGEQDAEWLCRHEPKSVHNRHLSTYYSGQMDEDMQFRFRGPEKKLDLWVENLKQFVQIGRGVDDDTWMYHLKRKDYSCWFRKSIMDEDLADISDALAADSSVDAHSSRKKIFEYIKDRYETLG